MDDRRVRCELGGIRSRIVVYNSIMAITESTEDAGIDACRMELENVVARHRDAGAPIGTCFIEPIDLDGESPTFRVLVEVSDENWPIDEYLEFRRDLTSAALEAPCTMPVVVDLGASD